VRSERLNYEVLDTGHAAELSEALTDPRVYEFISGQYPKTKKELEERFRSVVRGPRSRSQERWLNYCIRRQCDGIAIGRLEATLSEGRGEVAYLLGTHFWGKGYATEALAWLHGQLSNDQSIAETWATTEPGNDRSIRLLQRSGFIEIFDNWPSLQSYDPGDRVFRASLPSKLNP